MKKRIVYFGIWFLVLAANLAAWISTAFADWYVCHIFPIWVETYGRVTGLFSCSVGEWMLYGFCVLVVFSVLLGVAVMLRAVIGRKKPGKISRKFFRFMACFLLLVCVIMTLNCFILYHTTPLSEQILTEGSRREYTVEELASLRDALVAEANRLSGVMERDADGAILYDGDVKAQAIAEMQRLGESYPQLSGYYPRTKGLFFSGFFSQQYILGYYFPFSMEANYNREMYLLNEPATDCHELSHLKGVLFEDDANLVGFLACIDSESDFFRYSGILSVLGYVDQDFYNSIGQNEEIYRSHPEILPQVRQDDVFLTKEAWDRVEQRAILPTETVKKVSHGFLDKNLVLNGVESGIASYRNVVWLLLRYYDIMDISQGIPFGNGDGYGKHDILCSGKSGNI